MTSISHYAIEILNLIKSGDRPKDIHAKTGIPKPKIRYWADQFGIPLFRRGRSSGHSHRVSGMAEAMQKMRKDDKLTLNQIGSKFGVSRQRVFQLIGNTGELFLKQSRVKSILSELPAIEVAKFNVHQPLFGSSRHAWKKSLAKYHHALTGSGPASIGQNAERLVSKILFDLGIENKLMPIGWPFDILLVKNSIRIDVKFCSRSKFLKGSISPSWKFKCKSARSNSDFHVFVLGDSGVWFVIPTHRLNKADGVQFCWPTSRPTMHKYLNYKFVPFETPITKVDAFTCINNR